LSELLIRERSDGIEILTINRPEVRNALNPVLNRLLEDAFLECDADPQVRVIILTGAGEKAFSSGMDLKSFARGEFDIGDQGFGGITRLTLSKPVIAAVNGLALAGGFEIVLSCDLVIASEDATFGIPEVARGLMAAAGGLVRLPRRIPPPVAYEIALTGLPIGAQRAFELGLVNRVVAPSDVLSAAIELARSIVANAPLSVSKSLEVMRKAHELSEQDAWILSNRAYDFVSHSSDATEGAEAFAQRRSPIWTGH
jgi:enoyl-CoA hydratase